MKKISKLSIAGILIALNIVMTRIFSYTVPIAGMPTLRLSFGEIPIFLSGALLGPFYGAACGAIADLVGFPINPTGPYFPGFTFSAAMTGFIPGLIIRYFKNYKVSTLVVAITTSHFITSIVLNTMFLNLFYGVAVMALLPARIFSFFVMVPIYVFLTNILLKSISHTRLRTLT